MGHCTHQGVDPIEYVQPAFGTRIVLSHIFQSNAVFVSVNQLYDRKHVREHLNVGVCKYEYMNKYMGYEGMKKDSKSRTHEPHDT